MEISPSQRPSPLAGALAQLAGVPPGRVLRHLLAHAPLISFTLDADGVIVRSEGRARDALVQRRGDSLGRRAQDVYADVPEILDLVERALRGEHAAGRVAVSGLAFDCVLTPIWDGGRLVGVEGVATPPLAGAPGDARHRAAPEAARAGAAASLESGGFSVRQAEILCWLARGLRQSEIARRLFVSPSTVHTHTGALRERLGVATTTELRRYGQARGWHLLVDDPEPDDG